MTWQHGTVNGYNNQRCRCEECRAAHSAAHYRYMHADPDRLARHAERRMAAYYREEIRKARNRGRGRPRVVLRGDATV